MSTQISEDEIIKKRLLIEGDSGNEDRCINKLIKLFIKWCNSTTNEKSQQSQQQQQQQSDEDLNEVTNAHEMMLAVMSHIEFGLMRNQFILDMNKLEQDNYDNLFKNIDFDIEKAKRDIIQSKIDLQDARKIRKNRQEYDVLAREINNYPDREEMQSTIERLDKQLEQLKETKADLNHKIELRRKQFSVLLKSLSSLKNLIENDQYNDFNQFDNDDLNVIESRMELSANEGDTAEKPHNANHRYHHDKLSRISDYINEASPASVKIDNDIQTIDDDNTNKQNKMEMDDN